jgi:hypothetical protein
MKTLTQKIAAGLRKNHEGEWFTFIGTNSLARYDAEEAAEEANADYGWSMRWHRGKLQIIDNGENVGEWVSCRSCDSVFPMIGGNCFDEDFCLKCGARSRGF